MAPLLSLREDLQGDIGRGFVVGAATGFFGGVGFGAKSASAALSLEGCGVGSTIGSLLGSLVGGALTGVDAVSQAIGGNCAK